MTLVPSALVILEIGSCFLPRLLWTVILQLLLAQQVCTVTPNFFLLGWGLAIFLPGMSCNHDPPDLSLSCSFG
jgi:hypothetical protein